MQLTSVECRGGGTGVVKHSRAFVVPSRSILKQNATLFRLCTLQVDLFKGRTIIFYRGLPFS